MKEQFVKLGGNTMRIHRRALIALALASGLVAPALAQAVSLLTGAHRPVRVVYLVTDRQRPLGGQ